MIEFLKQNFELLLLAGILTAVCSTIVWAIIYYLYYAVRSQTLGKTYWCGHARRNLVALTFDDGPSPETLEILDVLKNENVKATFFLIGRKAENHPEIVRRIINDGHELGNHSYSHPIFLFCRTKKDKT